MKINVLLLTALITSVSGLSQQLSPQVIATTGNHFTSAGYQLQYTLGETITETLIENEHTLTQGFHQTELTITTILETAEVSVLLFPVPARDLVFIKFNSPNAARSFNLFDMSGKLIDFGSINPAIEIFELPVSKLANGTYLLNLHFDQSIIQPYKLQVTR